MREFENPVAATFRLRMFCKNADIKSAATGEFYFLDNPRERRERDK
jgi:hypothetical protein